ncbi:YlbF family regulator [Paraclostridium bifermentans]|uniref:YlbF family regulator n=1 Tax=Paraclostridium bifermentans TaxID=1490 RepID=UPI0021C36FFA|nr:YlbF family regulator [Paraclostridium bifermentans]GKZ02187.1 hypothetical protein ANS014_06210 [Paraclostridium bifermentans]
MGVYESTTKLASDIKDSKEYKEFRKHMKVVRSNPNYELILNNHKKNRNGYKVEKIKRGKIR